VPLYKEQTVLFQKGIFHQPLEDKELGPGKCGIKFEEGVSENDGTVEYCFELEGQFDTVLRDVAAKGGPAPDVVNRNCLEGPDCP
jgi:hypothetical protein